MTKQNMQLEEITYRARALIDITETLQGFGYHNVAEQVLVLTKDLLRNAQSKPQEELSECNDLDNSCCGGKCHE